MTLAWGIVAVVVIMALVAVTRWLRLFAFAFALFAAGLLFLYWQDNPSEATMALAALGGGLGLAGPVRRMIFRGFL